MKKLISIMALICAFIAAPNFCAAQTLSKSDSKAIEKDVKKRCKELKKQKWEPLASTSTMEYSMTKYRKYLAADEENRIPITGIAQGKNNKIGRENAVNNGISNYAQRAAAHIVGKLKSVMSSDGHNVSSEDIDKFGAAYQAAVNTKLSGLVKEHFALYRTGKDGMKEYNVFMSLDETQARKAREEANKLAAEQARLDQISKMADDFIGETVEGEE